MTNDLVADHYTIYCVQKKACENHDTTFKSVRDYSKFDQKVFETLIGQADWVLFDTIIDPNIQWDIMMENILKILSVMCPLKNIYARQYITFSGKQGHHCMKYILHIYYVNKYILHILHFLGNKAIIV